jgi:hypothetical protein
LTPRERIANSIRNRILLGHDSQRIRAELKVEIDAADFGAEGSGYEQMQSHIDVMIDAACDVVYIFEEIGK